MESDQGQESNAAPAPTPIDTTMLSPTSSFAPTWDGHPLTVLIQLDDFPQETGFSISSKVNGENVIFLQRQEGYYKQSQQFVVEKVQIPEGINAVIILTDKEGDGLSAASAAMVTFRSILLPAPSFWTNRVFSSHRYQNRSLWANLNLSTQLSLRLHLHQ